MSTACNQTIPVSDEFKKMYIRTIIKPALITNIAINDEDDKIMNDSSRDKLI